MAAANVFGHSVLVPTNSALGFGTDEATAVSIIVVPGDPNAVPAGGTFAAKGSLAIDTVTPTLWKNTTGANIWVLV